ncbi:sulfate adenylyltransferase [Planctomonas sp. JC2975]|uniref:sulfate adenylyltransferase subunit 1 n=1 Tax=Planctomonas sp. JC2975 TaxID=2729626 RepID=UPI00147469C8|nr:GTP-binding protein [Planctomonas sp. JC2975]NNC11362.1 sulfate adenylyltransferase [Planctomonas sp. JC2975]
MTATLFRFATAGSVDDGKSTLVGRLLHDSKSILADQWDAITRASEQRGFAGGERVDLALLTDGLRAEREQGITIDVAYRYFATDRRSFILADCPGHVQYTRNMVTGSTTADAVVVLIDVRHGVLEQTRRHLSVVQLLRVPHLIVAVNKIDLVGYDEATFRSVERDVLAVAADLGIDEVSVVPVSALEGDNVVNASEHTPWYDGLPLLDLLETLEVIDEVENTLAPFRLPVQTVIRPQGALAPGLDADAYRDYRAFAGQVASGSVNVGDEVTVLPAGIRTRVAGIDVAGRSLDTAVASQSVALRLSDDVDAARGSVIVAAGEEPELVSELTASLFWLDPRPLQPGSRVLVKYGTATVQALVTTIDGRRDLETLELEPADRLQINDIGTARLKLAAALPLLAYSEHRRAGAFVVIQPQDGATLAAGIVSRAGVETDPANAFTI